MQVKLESIEENVVTNSFLSFLNRHWKLITAITTTWTLAGLGVGLGLGFAGSIPFLGLGAVVTAPLFTAIGFLLGLVIGVSGAIFHDWFKNKLPLPEIPKDVLRVIGYNLPTQELSRMTRANKFFKESLEPDLLVRKFLEAVAHGNQDEAERMLEKNPNLMISHDSVTDYSGRTFNCSAYEYAYWAKDTHMCRMLELHMDENTKAQMLNYCEAIEEYGLKYRQNGTEYRTSHFDFSQLEKAMEDYLHDYFICNRTHNSNEIEPNWLNIGLAQRDVPVHVINEYCRPDRSFTPIPEFNEDKLPRMVTFIDYQTGEDKALFPLVISYFSGLGVDFWLSRADRVQASSVKWCKDTAVHIDLKAIRHLDSVRTAELTQSRENLKPMELKLGNS